MIIVLLNPSSIEYWVVASVCRETSLAHSSRRAGASGPSVSHRKPFLVLMSPAPICPVQGSVGMADGCRFVLMQRVKTLVEECVMTVCVPDVFHPPGCHGYAVSSDGMSSCIVSPTTVLWLTSPTVMCLVSSFEKRAHPNSFTNACLSRSANFPRFLKICLLVVSSCDTSRNSFLIERNVSTQHAELKELGEDIVLVKKEMNCESLILARKLAKAPRGTVCACGR